MSDERLSRTPPAPTSDPLRDELDAYRRVIDVAKAELGRVQLLICRAHAAVRQSKAVVECSMQRLGKR